MLDLQQLHTGLIQREQIAQTVLATVISYYPGRGVGDTDEALCDAGAIALSKDTGPSGSYGEVVGKPWVVGRISQEHGILVRNGGPKEDKLELGTLVEIVGQVRFRFTPVLPHYHRLNSGVQHACLIAASQPWYYIIDSQEGGKKVVDIWVPWKGW